MTHKTDAKILVATAFPPDVPGGSPWLFYQLLRGADPSRISWWSISGHAPEHTRERVGTYREGRLPSRLVPHKRFVALKCFLLEVLWVPLASARLRRFISDQKPDLLWILGYGWSIPVLHRALRGLSIPWHMSVHDMADTDGQVASLGAKRAARFQRMLEDLYARAASRDVYTEEIGIEMQCVTGKKHDLIIHCGAEPEEIERIRNKTIQKSDDKIRIGYPGTIISEDTFSRFMAALKLLPVDLAKRVEVNLFGIHSYRDRPWYDEAVIVEHGYLQQNELDRQYSDCDWGLVIMALDNSDPRYNQYSFPCKFARALAMGLPVIAIGNPNCSLTQFANQYKLGCVITHTNPGMIADALRVLLLKNGTDTFFREEILRCIHGEFNATLNRENLHRLFESIMRG